MCVLVAELDNTGVITDDDEDMPEYADVNIEVTDDMIDQASDKRNEAMDAMAEGGCCCITRYHSESGLPVCEHACVLACMCSRRGRELGVC